MRPRTFILVSSLAWLAVAIVRLTSAHALVTAPGWCPRASEPARGCSTDGDCGESERCVPSCVCDPVLAPESLDPCERGTGLVANHCDASGRCDCGRAYSANVCLPPEAEPVAADLPDVPMSEPSASPVRPVEVRGRPGGGCSIAPPFSLGERHRSELDRVPAS